MTESGNGRSPALVVFGGTGFVGTAVLAQALQLDEDITLLVVSRTGRAPAWLAQEPVYQTDRLVFLPGDLLNPHTVRESLQQVTDRYQIVGCISCVGAITPWSQQNMIRMCGDANINAYRISREIGARKFAVITRDRSNMDDWWYPFPHIIPGYYAGKRKIESYVEQDTENQGNAICIRAGFVAGTRRTIPGLPSWLTVSVPLSPMYRYLDRLCPSIGVNELAAAAVRFVLSEQKAASVFVTNDAIPTFFNN